MKRSGFLFPVGVLIGIAATTVINNTIARAQATESWSRDRVTAMIFVKPQFGAFVPAEGNSIGVTWTKSEIVPICLVKQSIGGFEPAEGDSIGIVWSRNDVKPIVFVEPYLGRFVTSIQDSYPAQSIPTPVPAAPDAHGSAACASAVETHIAGDFNGWEGETLYKMDDGTIWRQANYHYHYHYAYHPSVIIFPSRSGTCHIRVEDDDDDGVDVVRIK
jgi:hypothetical protein